MRDRGRAFAQRNFNLMLGNHRTRQRSPQQILMFVHRARLQRGENISGQKFLAQVFHHHLAGAGLVGLFDDGFDVVSLAHIAHHGDHIVGIVFFQPRNDDGGIQTSGIRKHNFLRHERSSLAGDPPPPSNK